MVAIINCNEYWKKKLAMVLELVKLYTIQRWSQNLVDPEANDCVCDRSFVHIHVLYWLCFYAIGLLPNTFNVVVFVGWDRADKLNQYVRKWRWEQWRVCFTWRNIWYFAWKLEYIYFFGMQLFLNVGLVSKHVIFTNCDCHSSGDKV